MAVGSSDTDGIAIGSNKLSLNGGSIKDAADNDATLSHSALEAQSNHKVDGIRPTITGAPYFIQSTFSSDGVHTTGEFLEFSVLFSEDVIVVGTPQLKLDVGGTARYVNPLSNSRDSQMLFFYRVVRGDLDRDGVSIDANGLSLNGSTIKDAAGNDAVLNHEAAALSRAIIDAVPATVSSIAITSDPGSDNSYGVGERIEVTVTFSESVQVPRLLCNPGGGRPVVCMPRLELNIGGVAKIARTHEYWTITGTSIVFRYWIQQGDNDADGISIGANKLMLNVGWIKDDVGDGGEDADITHSAVADDSGHKVVTSTP